jgi:hypothetical protein
MIQNLQTSFIRSIIALGNGPLESLNFAKRNWPGDRDTLSFIEKGAVVPTSSTTTGLPNTSVANLIRLIGPIAAASQIFKRCVQLGFDRGTTVLLPSITQSASGVAYIAEGAPFPIKQLSLSGASLTPKKLGMGVVLTRELLIGSNAEALLKAVMAENLSLGIESLLFDAVAASTTRPAGLRNSVSATVATAGGGIDAMITDLAALAAAIAPVAQAQENICFVASPGEAIKISLRAPFFRYPVYSSAALAAGVVMSIATNCLAVAADDAPRFEVSDSTAVHMEDTSPAQLGVVGTPNVIAAPTRSLFQTDTRSIRVIMDLNFVLRTSGAVAWTENVTW